jgi:hypothetical protein
MTKMAYIGLLCKYENGKGVLAIEKEGGYSCGNKNKDYRESGACSSIG